MSEPSEIYALCRTYGSLCSAVPHVDGSKMMAAIAWNESSCGQDMTPRHEPAYDFGGIYAKNPTQAELLKAWGSKAAYSYGPWQMMLCNAIGFTPNELFEDNEKCALAFVGFFNRYIVGVHHAGNLAEILECYNSGHIVRGEAEVAPGVQRYINDGVKYYYTVNVPEAVSA